MKFIFVANWKLYLDFNQSLNFCTQHQADLKKLSHNANIILCPSFVTLTPIIEIFKNSAIAIGAQNCSEYSSGPYTGEVSAQILAQADVKYCIVGHSERRIHFKETSEIIAQKIQLLYQCDIQPIICIGETEKEYQTDTTIAVLTQQLESVNKSIPKNKHIIIAYEPVFSIGTGIMASEDHLEKTFTWLRQWFTDHFPDNTIQLLYGGSVNPTNIDQLKQIANVNGFLIGQASTDFESISKILFTDII